MSVFTVKHENLFFFLFFFSAPYTNINIKKYGFLKNAYVLANHVSMQAIQKDTISNLLKKSIMAGMDGALTMIH